MKLQMERQTEGRKDKGTELNSQKPLAEPGFQKEHAKLPPKIKIHYLEYQDYQM